MENIFPSYFWSIVSGLALIGWILAVVGMIGRGICADGSINGKQGFIWMSLFIILYVVWIVGVNRL
jgi:hypothetical protein